MRQEQWDAIADTLAADDWKLMTNDWQLPYVRTSSHHHLPID